jgi:hypothetical protein
MNSTTPKRLPIVDDLVRSLMVCASTIKEIKDQPDEVNCSLAFCEVAVSLPPAWFSLPERLLIVSVIQELTGKNAIEFIDNLDDDSISYYNKCRSPNGKDINEVVEQIFMAHAAAFPN